MFHQPEKKYSDIGKSPDISTGPDALWQKQEDHTAAQLCPSQGMWEYTSASGADPDGS